MSDKIRQYIGLRDRYSKDIGHDIFKRIDSWRNSVERNGLGRQWRENYRMYHNAEPDGTAFGADSFSVVGESGDLLRVRINEFRNLITHVLNMTVTQKVALQAKAASADSESIIAAQLYDGVLDYYLRHWKKSHVSKQMRRAVELSLLMSNGYLLVEWDPAAGDPYIDDGEGGVINRGDLRVKCRSVLDVVFDTNCEDDDELDWVVIRDTANKYELAARYPDKADEILQLESVTDVEPTSQFGWDEETDLVHVYKFFHRSNAVVPRGRVVYALSADLILLDQDNPYTDENNNAILPLLTMRASDGIGTLFGYSPANDLAPVQKSMNMLMTTIMTNEAAFGIGNVAVERGSDLSVQQLAGGLSVVEYEQGRNKPEAFSVKTNNQQTLEIAQFISGKGEMVSGINSVVRGNPDDAMKASSGRALGLIQAMAVQFNSALQDNYQQFTQDFGNLLLLIIKKFAQAPQITAIVGDDRIERSVSWNGDSFHSVARVTCEPVNPLSKTIGGRVEEAETLLNAGLITSAKQYMTVRTTGQLEPLYRIEQSLDNLLQQENEELMRNNPNVPVLVTDDHEAHIEWHLSLLNSPKVRMNSSILPTVLSHVQQHKDLMMQSQAPQQQVSVPQQGGNEQEQPSNEQSVQTPRGQELPLPDTAQVTPGMSGGGAL